MFGKNEMTQIYLRTAPAFLAFLENEREKLEAEIAKLQGGDGAPDPSENKDVLSSTAESENETVENESGSAMATAEPDLETNDTKTKRRRLGGLINRRKN